MKKAHFSGIMEDVDFEIDIDEIAEKLFDGKALDAIFESINDYLNDTIVEQTKGVLELKNISFEDQYIIKYNVFAHFVRLLAEIHSDDIE